MGTRANEPFVKRRTMLGADVATALPADSPEWLLLSLFLSTLASEDLACVLAGALVASGQLSLGSASVACVLGILAGDLGLYAAGRFLWAGVGRSSWLARRVPAGAMTAMRTTFERRGLAVLFAARFVPGSRLPLFVAAGALRYPVGRFLGVLAVAASAWTPVLVGAAAAAGSSVSGLASGGRADAFVVALAALLCGALVVVLSRLATAAGRRRLAARWRRWTHWEYWPAWAVYPPVAAALLVEAVRRRRLLSFTACNPGIPMGGIALESKGDILDQLPRDLDAPIAVAAYERLPRARPLAESLRRVAAMLANGPIVLKPDQGERGAGVAVVRDLAHAERWLAACPFDAIAQRWVGGVEFGVVWRRRPGGGSEIRSIAKKVPPSVVGDGRSTLRELLWRDERAAPLAAVHEQNHAHRVDHVVAKDEVVRLSELGTHCRGATFFDARELRTPRLEAAFEEFLRRSPGLDFGRFDVRVPDDESMRSGEGIRVLEFNGVTGEPAHVYQPGYAYWRGVRDMIAHWRAACATGDANAKRGHRPAPVRSLWRLLGELRRRPRFEAPAASPGEATEDGASFRGTVLPAGS